MTELKYHLVVRMVNGVKQSSRFSFFTHAVEFAKNLDGVHGIEVGAVEITRDDVRWDTKKKYISLTHIPTSGRGTEPYRTVTPDPEMVVSITNEEGHIKVDLTLYSERDERGNMEHKTTTLLELKEISGG